MLFSFSVPVFMLLWRLGQSWPVDTANEKRALSLESKVFVAFSGKDLTIVSVLKKPANQTKDVLRCFSPFDLQIYVKNIHSTSLKPVTYNLQLELKNLTSSGEYYCKYKTATAYWFLRVRAIGYRKMEKLDTDFIPLSILIGVLLIFSVVGSAYVFRGHWKEKITEWGRKQHNREEEKEKEKEVVEDKMDMKAAQSTSFYASLEARPRSIYDVLDPSAAKAEPDQRNKGSKTKKLVTMVPQTAEPQDESTFECVYENF
ncbi:NFAT activation molecule 1 [Xenentodon cancila]